MSGLGQACGEVVVSTMSTVSTVGRGGMGGYGRRSFLTGGLAIAPSYLVVCE